ncbi:MAG: RHS domain-containing protein [Deltaproteobacteria bacterium]|nr:RHS domain-containing protein [Deltaproteobacteria bacterium]
MSQSQEVRADIGGIVVRINERGANAVLDDDDIKLGKQLFGDLEQVVDHLEGLAPGDPSYLYDGAGNITAETASGTLFTYDSLGRLMLVSNTGGAVLGHYVYDGMNRRVIKSALGTMTVYLYDIYNNLIEEYDVTTGTATKDYLYLGQKPLAMITPVSSGYSFLPPWFSCSMSMMRGGHDCASTGTSPFDVIVYILPFLAIIVLRYPDASPQRERGRVRGLCSKFVIISIIMTGSVLIITFMVSRQTHAQVTSEQVYYYHLDHLGTPIEMTNQNQNVVWQANYDPFGAATINTAVISNNLRFPGMYADTETGLYYNINRYYYPSIGRYIEPDKLDLSIAIAYQKVMRDRIVAISSNPIFNNMDKILARFLMRKELENYSGQGLAYGLPAGLLPIQNRPFLMDPQGLNLYAYAENNPIKNIDINGLKCSPAAWLACVFGCEFLCDYSLGPEVFPLCVAGCEAACSGLKKRCGCE